MPILEQPDTLFKLKKKKPIIPSAKEIKDNVPSRTAKLRYVVKKSNFFDFETDINDEFENLIRIENFGKKL